MSHAIVNYVSTLITKMLRSTVICRTDSNWCFVWEVYSCPPSGLSFISIVPFRSLATGVNLGNAKNYPECRPHRDERESWRIECGGAFLCIIRTSSVNELKIAPEHIIGYLAHNGIVLDEIRPPRNLLWQPLLKGNVTIQGACIEAHYWTKKDPTLARHPWDAVHSISQITRSLKDGFGLRLVARRISSLLIAY